MNRADWYGIAVGLLISAGILWTSWCVVIPRQDRLTDIECRLEEISTRLDIEREERESMAREMRAPQYRSPLPADYLARSRQ